MLIWRIKNGSCHHFFPHHFFPISSISSLPITISSTYDGFGNLIASSGSAVNTYGFTGEQQFSEADNLVFLRARYYKPSFGRFISRDPIGFKDDTNLYMYVENNPIKHVDPFGLITCEERCERIYRIDVAICGYKFTISLCRGNVVGAPIGWMICMHKARANHMRRIEDCGDRDFEGR